MTVYNSVDKSYYKQATDKLNDLFNSDKMKEYQELQNKKDIPALKEKLKNKTKMRTTQRLNFWKDYLQKRKQERKIKILRCKKNSQQILADYFFKNLSGTI